MRDARVALILALVLGVALPACGGDPSSPRPSQNVTPNVAGQPGPDRPSSESDQRLSAEVTRFLDAWVVKRQPQAAVAGKTSTAFGDRRFVPAAALSPQEYKAQEAAAAAASSTPISAQAFQSAIETQLASLLGDGDPSSAPQSAAPTLPPTLAEMMVPLSPEAAREKERQLWRLIADRNPRPLMIAGIPSLAYRVREWRDISWTASATIGFRFAMANIITQQNINLQAVVSRLKPPSGQSDESVIVTLWSDEGRGGAEWRFVGVESLATQ